MMARRKKKRQEIMRGPMALDGVLPRIKKVAAMPTAETHVTMHHTNIA
jgi:hypothetical protein